MSNHSQWPAHCDHRGIHWPAHGNHDHAHWPAHSGHSHVGHTVTHSSDHNYTAANQSHFDEDAHRYDERPELKEMARRFGQAMLKSYPFDEDTTTVMDYACGTGLISRELAAYTKSIVGVDISQAMVDRFNNRVSDQGIPSDEMKAVCSELRGEEGELDGQKFDVIVCASAYHHFNSIEDVTRILSFFLKPGGSLLVADIIKPDNTDIEVFPSQANHIVAHKAGFDEEEIRKTFEGAGLGSFSFERAVKQIVNQ